MCGNILYRQPKHFRCRAQSGYSATAKVGSRRKLATHRRPLLQAAVSWLISSFPSRTRSLPRSCPSASCTPLSLPLSLLPKWGPLPRSLPRSAMINALTTRVTAMERPPSGQTWPVIARWSFLPNRGFIFLRLCPLHLIRCVAVL